MALRYHNVFGGIYYPGEHDIVVVDNTPDPVPDTTPPAVPATASPTAANSQVVLNWADNTEPDFNHYKIYRATVTGGPYTEIATSTSSDYTATGLTNGTTYYFVTTAEDDEGNESAESVEVSATPAAGVAPAAPTSLVATAGDNQVALDWADNGEGDLAHYRVYRGTVTGGPYTLIASPTASAYTATGLVSGTEYFFVVTAVNDGNDESPESNEDSDIPTGAAPDTTAPATPTGLGATAGTGQVVLNWADNGEGDLDHYGVYRSLSSGGTYTPIAAPTVSAYTDSAVAAGTPYWYKVSAVDETGNESAQTSNVTATPTAPAAGVCGASGFGTTAEPASTTGTQVASLGSITAQGTTYLLNAGTYTGNLTIPANSTVKPYNGGTVRINGAVNFNNGSTLAGIHVEVPNTVGWASRITSRSNVTIRNCKYRGGKHEAIRIDGSSNGVLVRGCDIDGGFENHAVKVNGEGGTPNNITFRNCQFTKTHFGGGEDLLQIEFWTNVTVENCTFKDNPSGEDGFDVKQGSGLTFRNNLIEGSNINAENALFAGDITSVVVEDNCFNDGFVSLGAGYTFQSPTWTFQNNEMDNGTLRVRKSFNATHTNNTFTSSTIQIGTYAADDYPRNATFSGNSYTSCTFQVQQASGLVKDW